MAIPSLDSVPLPVRTPSLLLRPATALTVQAGLGCALDADRGGQGSAIYEGLSYALLADEWSSNPGVEEPRP